MHQIFVRRTSSGSKFPSASFLSVIVRNLYILKNSFFSRFRINQSRSILSKQHWTSQFDSNQQSDDCIQPTEYNNCQSRAKNINRSFYVSFVKSHFTVQFMIFFFLHKSLLKHFLIQSKPLLL